MRLLQLLFQYSKPTVILAIAAGLFAGFCNAAILAIINQAIASFPRVQGWLIWSFIGLCVGLMVTATASQASVAKLSQDVVYHLILRLTRSILDAPYPHIERVGAPKLMAVLTKDVESISSASAVISGLCINLSLLLGCLVYVAWLSLPALVFLLVFLTVGMGLTNVILRQARDSLRQSRDDQDLLFRDFEGITLGIKELKLHFARRQSFYDTALIPHATAYRDRWVHAMFYFSLAGGIGLVLFFIPLGFLLFALPNVLEMSSSLLSNLALVIVFMLTPLRGILLGLPQLSQANISLKKVESLGLSLAQSPRGRPAPNVKSQWQKIEFREVVHTYPHLEDEHVFQLGPISFSLHPGEILFIIGGNGSGKSTLLKLLTGLYEPESGQMFWDGELICDREPYRQLFSAIFADFYLFHQILGLDQDHLDRQAQHYLQQLELDRKVQIQEGVLSTTALSQGQRKRLALLTAYLEDRPIYVFDEWASDQDPVFKEVFYCQLLPTLKQQGKTAIVISHDDRYFETGDRRIKLEEGRIVHEF